MGLENDDSNLENKVTSNIFKITLFQNYRIAPAPVTSQLWKLTLPPGKVVGSKFFR